MVVTMRVRWLELWLAVCGENATDGAVEHVVPVLCRKKQGIASEEATGIGTRELDIPSEPGNYEELVSMCAAAGGIAGAGGGYAYTGGFARGRAGAPAGEHQGREQAW